MKRVLIIGPILILILVLIVFFKDVNEDNYAKEYYKTGVILKGIVIEKKFFQKDQGLFGIEVIECNSKDFDLRKQGKEYNLVVKDKKAEFVSYYFPDINLNDTILIDFTKRNYKVINQNGVQLDNKLPTIMLSKWYPDELEKHHKL